MQYDRSGSGEPLVLVHGLGSRRGVWAPVDTMLAAHHDVFVVDLPGFGASAPDPRADGSIEGYANCVEALLTTLGVGRAHMVGNSMGGAVALELARRGRALSVTAFCPVGFWRRPGLVWCRTVLRTMQLAARAARPLLPFLASRVWGRWLAFGMFYGRPAELDPQRGLADAFGIAGSSGVKPALAAIGSWRPSSTPVFVSTPVTIAWGDRDRLLTYRTQASRASRMLPWAQHLRLPGAGHLPFADDPQACFEAVLATTGGAGVSRARRRRAGQSPDAAGTTG